MKKRYLIFFVLVLAVLTLTASGCGGEGRSLEGKNIVTFELCGGTLELKTSSVNTKINFAYHPNTYILDPAELPGYKIYRLGYNFTGWYTTPDCNAQDKWDFEKTVFNKETLTLYAGWELAVKHTYTVCYTDGDKTVELGKYDVKAGEAFEDWRGFAKLREGYTALAFYSDAELQNAWDNSFKHPGGEGDFDVPVYVEFIEGEWTLVNDLASLRSAINAGESVYLTSDIDCDGAAFSVSNLYKGILEGNGFSIKNFKVEQGGTLLSPGCYIFSELGEGAEIRNVSFTDVTYVLDSVNESVAKQVKCASLARAAQGAKITKVSISGKLLTNYTKELPKLNSAVFEDDSVFEETEFTANITIEQKQ